MKVKTLLCICALLFSLAVAAQSPQPERYPKREFRAAWIQAVNGQFRGIPTEKLKQTLLDQLNSLQGAGINAIIFQVRPEADALYASKLEPWSRFLTGVQGKAPNPYWDPMEFMIEECHKRGMEFHAWINPYRVKTSLKNELAPNHVYNIHPEWFVTYGDQLYFDPALPESRRHICMVVMDIVSRYDVDAIHMDDYFYPSLEEGESMNDNAEYEKYGKDKFKSIEEFRRNNVDVVIQNIQKVIIDTKPGVIFSVSPAANIDNNYSKLFADVRKWLKEGWVDVIIPQLYFATGTGKNSFNQFLDQWMQYVNQTHCLIGYGIYKFGSTDPDYGNAFHSSADLKSQFEYASKKSKVNGSVLYSIKDVVANKVGIGTAIKEIYKKKTVIPYLGRTEAKLPSTPVKVRTDGGNLSWEAVSGAYYAVYKSNGEGKLATLVGTTRETSFKLPGKGTYCVTALDKANAESRISELVTY